MGHTGAAPRSLSSRSPAMPKHLFSASWLAAVLACLALTASVEAQRHGGGSGGAPGHMPGHMPGGFGGGRMPRVMPNHGGGGFSGGGHITSLPQAHIPSVPSSGHGSHPATVTPPMHSVRLP